MAMAERAGRVTAAEASDGRVVLDELWTAVDVIELNRDLMSHAAQLAVDHGLRGYDAVHCAAAVAVEDPRLVAATATKGSCRHGDGSASGFSTPKQVRRPSIADLRRSAMGGSNSVQILLNRAAACTEKISGHTCDYD
jgi:hypothetical protein